MTTKTFCDVCGVQLNEGSNRPVTVPDVDSKPRTFDLCKTCHHRIIGDVVRHVREERGKYHQHTGG
jgi:hypothetical protein